MSSNELLHMRTTNGYSIMEILNATGPDVDDQLLLVSCTHIQNHIDAVASQSFSEC